ncbi:MAG: voltage-gated potassium channel [Gammaproteobacteria bacterium]|jgi:voltage-gated potassium channel
MFINRTGKFIYLLGSLLVLLVAGAFVQHIQLGNAIFNILLSITLLASIYAISQNRRFVFAGILLGSLTFASAWIAHLSSSTIPGLVSAFFGFCYFLYAALVILTHVFRAPTITADELLASVSTYLLLGIGGGFIFRFLELIDPSSLITTTAAAPEITAASPMSAYIYYSFTCLTTLGFGDVIPGTAEARVFSYLEAVIGQIFLTVLIARIVGLHISQNRLR